MLKNHGITLITLVITIIILLILAGVSIATLTGQNGLLAKANTARTETKKANAEEQVKIAVAGSLSDDGKLTVNKVKEELRKIPNVGEIRDTDGGFPIEVDLDGYTFIIDENGKVIRKTVKPLVNYTLSTKEQVAEGTQIMVTITATIGEEETITKITKPDGTSVVNTNTTNFSVTTNGIYTVIVEGSNGETTTTKIIISNIGTTEIFSAIYKTTTEYTDKNGNTAKIPKGFAVGISSTINTINDGLVITDGIDENHKSTGNQFVWIPVGKVKDNNGIIKKIELNRYTFADNGASTKQGTAVIDTYYEELAISDKGNMTAKDIETFKTSSTINHGFYIGRYEAGDATATSNRGSSSSKTTPIVCKEDQFVYNYILQTQAGTLARTMYPGKANLTSVISDLTNSYAWDTATVFIQEFSGDNNYANQKALQGSIAKTGKATDGINKDVRCNIYDMASNCWEWTTETGYGWHSSFGYLTCVRRGGLYGNNSYMSYRHGNPNSSISSSNSLSFRPILYLNDV